MSLKTQVEKMPVEKQVAWGVRLFMSLGILAFGTITWSALEKLDRIAEIQSAQTAVLAILVEDNATRRDTMDELKDMYYRLADQMRALGLRMDSIERRNDLPRGSRPDDPVSP